MAVLHVDTYNKYKDIIHPNIARNINYYRDGKLIILPPYHGCHHANKKGTRKLIDYARGQQCVLPTNKPYWKKILKISIKDKTYILLDM